MGGLGLMGYLGIFKAWKISYSWVGNKSDGGAGN